MKVAALMFADIENYHAVLAKTVNLITMVSECTDAILTYCGFHSIQCFTKALQKSAENR